MTNTPQVLPLESAAVVTPLETEIATWDVHRAQLLERARGKHVLIKGDRVVGVFDTRAQAVDRGQELLGRVPFLVKQILGDGDLSGAATR